MSMGQAAPRSDHEDVPRLPTFLVIGAMKAGTTSLYHYLRDHPQVFMPETKEVNFFNPRRNWHRGMTWYEEQFSAAPPGTVAVGEASTSYTKYPEVDGVPVGVLAELGHVDPEDPDVVAHGVCSFCGLSC